MKESTDKFNKRITDYSARSFAISNVSKAGVTNKC